MRLLDDLASALLRARAGWRALRDRRREDEDLDEELQSFLEASAAARVRAGATEEDARRGARLAMGSLDGAREEVRAVGWGSAVEALVRDVRLAGRVLARSPVFTAVAVLTLALAVGVNTAFVGALYSVLLRPLPYPNAERLVHIWAFWPGGFGNLPYPDYAAALERTRSFEGLAACESWGTVALTGGDKPVQLRTTFVSASYLSLLGANAAVGRLFREEDNLAEGGHPVVVLSHGLWQKRFGADPSVVGQAIRLNRAPYTVIGVLAPGFHGLGEVEDPPEPDVWLPTTMARSLLGQPPLTDQAFSIYWATGLLKPGVTVVQAREDLQALSRQLESEQPATHRAHGLDVEPISRYANGPLRRPLFLLAGGAVLVLLIGCVNVASSMLARL